MSKKDFIKAIENRPKSIRIIELISLFLGDSKIIWTDWIGNKEDTKNLINISKKFGFEYFIFKNIKVNRYQILISYRKSYINSFKKLYNEEKITPLTVGLELGYPECCVKSYNNFENSNTKSLIKYIYDNSSKNDVFNFYMNNICSPFSLLPHNIYNKKKYRKEFEKKSLKFQSLNQLNLYWYFINRILEPFIIWHPCSYQCRESIRRVKKIYDFFYYLLPSYAEIKRKYLSKPVFFKTEFNFALLNGKVLINNNKIVVKYKSFLKYPKTFISKRDINFINKHNCFEIENGAIKNIIKNSNFIILPFF